MCNVSEKEEEKDGAINVCRVQQGPLCQTCKLGFTVSLAVVLAHWPIEVPGKIKTEPFVRLSGPLCRIDRQATHGEERTGEKDVPAASGPSPWLPSAASALGCVSALASRFEQ